MIISGCRRSDGESHIDEIGKTMAIYTALGMKINMADAIPGMDITRRDEIASICNRIAQLPDSVQRQEMYQELVSAALSVDLSSIALADAPDPVKVTESERALAKAHAAMRYVVEESWKALMLESAPPEQQLRPWLQLIRRMKIEDERLQTAGKCQYEPIDFVERWFRKYKKWGNVKDRESIELLKKEFQEAAGRPICE